MEHTESRRRGPWFFRAVARAFLIRIVRAASATSKTVLKKESGSAIHPEKQDKAKLNWTFI